MTQNYAYKTNRGDETCKVRGFMLHFTNSELINFGYVKAMVTDPPGTAYHYRHQPPQNMQG